MNNMKFLIKDEDQSRRLQECLFAQGYKWAGGGQYTQYIDKGALFAEDIGYGKCIAYSDLAYYQGAKDCVATDPEQFIAAHTKAGPEASLKVGAVGILEEAAKIIGSRAVERDKGDSERSMSSCVQAFNALTKHTLTEEQGWLFMVVLKAARSQGGCFKIDDYLDGAAYFALAGEAAANG